MDDVNLVVPIPEGSECDPVPIRRPAGTEVVAAVRELNQARSIHVDHINIVIAHRSRVKRQPCTILGPTAATAHVRQVGYLLDRRAIFFHYIQLALTRPCGSESDPLSIRRPGGVNILRTCGDGMRVISIHSHHPNLLRTAGLVGKDDSLPRWGTLRRVQTADAASETSQGFPFEIHRINIEGSRAAGNEIDGAPLRRNRGIVGRRVFSGKLGASRSIRVHQADLVDLVDIAGEYNFATGRRCIGLRHRRGDHRPRRRCRCGCDDRRQSGWDYAWRGKLKERGRSGSRDNGGCAVQHELCRRRSRTRSRWVSPDVEKTSHEETKRDQAAAHSAEQESVKNGIEFCGRFHELTHSKQKFLKGMSAEND